jgi:carboxylate-amine ligase
MLRKQDFTIGIEEEYLLVDPVSRDLVADPPEALLNECQQAITPDIGAVTPEFLRAQIEVGTPVCRSLTECREKLTALRGFTARAAEAHGLRIIAASTHPFAAWAEQRHTDRDRYNLLARDLQGVARRLLICGMHVHVGIADNETRNDLLNQLGYFLPHLLALTTSSPFWQGQNTGLKSYRLSVFDELPRTGLPEKFDSYGEYQRHIAALVKAGLIEDASKVWWDIRPSARFPTLELRITDICTRLEDGLTVAALYACIISMLLRLKRNNQRWRMYANMLVQENRWRAQRYGLDEGMVDFGRGEIVPYPDLLEEIIALVAEDAEQLGCVGEVQAARNIVKRGTSAHRQVAVYEKALAGGAEEEEALQAVVDWLIAETLTGVALPKG